MTANAELERYFRDIMHRLRALGWEDHHVRSVLACVFGEEVTPTTPETGTTSTGPAP